MKEKIYIMENYTIKNQGMEIEGKVKKTKNKNHTGK